MVVFFILLIPFILHMALTQKTTKKKKKNHDNYNKVLKSLMRVNEDLF